MRPRGLQLPAAVAILAIVLGLTSMCRQNGDDFDFLTPLNPMRDGYEGHRILRFDAPPDTVMALLRKHADVTERTSATAGQRIFQVNLRSGATALFRIDRPPDVAGGETCAIWVE